VRESWNEPKALLLLQKWIEEDKWEGTTHFRKHNSSLYEFLYRTMGMDTEFEKLGLDYDDFKKSKGKHLKVRPEKEVLNDLNALIESGKWQGPKHLSIHHSSFHRELNRIGYQNAFEKLDLDYKDYRYAVWSKDEILSELEKVIENKEWHGIYHLKLNNGKLYNAIVREFGFPKAFRELGLNYHDYKLYN